MERKPSEVTEVLDEFLSDYLFPPQDDGSDPRACPQVRRGRPRGRPAEPARRALRRLRRLRELSRMQVHAAASPSRAPMATRATTRAMGTDPETGLEVERKSGRFGPYVQLGEGKEAKRA